MRSGTAYFLQKPFNGLRLRPPLGDCEPPDGKLMEEPSAAYIACESRGFPWRVANAWGAAGAAGKSPNVGDWGGAA